MSLNYQTLKNIIKEVIEEGVSPESLGNDLSSIEATKKDYDRAEKMDTQAKVERQAKAIKDSKKLIQRLKAVEEILGRDAAQPFYDKAVELGFSDEQLSSLGGGSGKPTTLPKPKVEDVKDEPVIKASNVESNSYGLTKAGIFRSKQKAEDYLKTTLTKKLKEVGEELKHIPDELYSELNLDELFGNNIVITDADYDKYLGKLNKVVKRNLLNRAKDEVDYLIKELKVKNPRKKDNISLDFTFYKNGLYNLLKGYYDDFEIRVPHKKISKVELDSYIDGIVENSRKGYSKDRMSSKLTKLIKEYEDDDSDKETNGKQKLFNRLMDLKNKYIHAQTHQAFKSFETSNKHIDVESDNVIADYVRGVANKASDGKWYGGFDDQLNFPVTTTVTYFSRTDEFPDSEKIYVFDNNIYNNIESYEKAMKDANYDIDNPQMNPDIVTGDDLKADKEELVSVKKSLDGVYDTIYDKLVKYHKYSSESERLSKLKSKRSIDTSKQYKEYAEDLLVEMEDLLESPKVLDYYNRLGELQRLINPSNRKSRRIGAIESIYKPRKMVFDKNGRLTLGLK